MADRTSDRFLNSFQELWSELEKEARNRAERQLLNQVTRLEEKFGATATWLFLDRGEHLEALITQGARSRGYKILKLQKSIVSHVAATAQGYFTNDVAKDPYYLRLLAGTQAEMAVPICTGEGCVQDPTRPPGRSGSRFPLGILNLESSRQGVFGPAQMDELQAEVYPLVPHLLILKTASKCPWNPEIHGWDLRDVLGRFCYAMTESLNEDQGGQLVTATIWYVDWAKGELYVYASSGVDQEYIKEQTLPMDSFTGTIASRTRKADRRQNVELTTLEVAIRDLRFRRADKLEPRNLRQIMSVPIFLPPEAIQDKDSKDKAISVLNVYFFGNPPPDSMPNTESLGQVADKLGALIGHFRSHRTALAKAYLNRKLQEQSQSSWAAFRTIQEVLIRVLSADAGTVFAHHHGDRNLWAVATTGLEGPRLGTGSMFGVVMPGVGAFYNLDRDLGFTTFLARNRGVCVRKNDVMNPEEKGIPPGFPQLPLNKYPETFALSEIDRRRFLGAGVHLPGSKPIADQDSILGVFRVNRSAMSRPFTLCDEMLLEELAALDTCRKVFADWLLERMPIEGKLPASWRTQISSAVTNFLRPLRGAGPPLTLTDGLLQNLVAMFRGHSKYRVYRAAVRLFPSAAEQVTLVRQVIRPDLMQYAPKNGDEHFRKVEEALRLYYPRVCTVTPETPVLLSRSQTPSESVAADLIVFTVLLPVFGWNGRYLLRGALVLDFVSELTQASAPSDFRSSSDLGLLFRAAHKLTAILGGVGPRLTPDSFLLHPRAALDRFLSFPIEHGAIGARWSRLWLDLDGKLQTIGTRSADPHWSIEMDSDQDWHLSSRQDEAEYGISFGRRACSIPLLLGPYKIGELHCGLPDGPQAREESVRIIPGLWSRLTFGMQEFWEINFEPISHGQEITEWKQNIHVGLILPSRNRPMDESPLATDF